MHFYLLPQCISPGLHERSGYCCGGAVVNQPPLGPYIYKWLYIGIRSP